MDSDLVQILDANQVQFVRILWCDNANVIRAKAFHRQFLAEHVEWGISMAQAQQALPVMFDAVAANSGLGPAGEVWLTPDWSTLSVLPYAPGHARVMGNMRSPQGEWPLCPRAFLRRQVADAASDGLEVMAAFEYEFYLLKAETLHPIDQTVFASTLAMDLSRGVISEIVAALTAQGIALEHYYPESGPGQHEFAIRYAPAMQTADWHIAVRETIRGVALKHGLRVSFLPKIFAHSGGNGCHLHLSLWRDGQNLFPGADGHLSTLGQSFIAGILSHLPALMTITTPTPNSFRRLQPHFWSGAYRCWGVDNREVAVRVPSNPTRPSPTHIELKTVDASANPYLALGSVIAAGLDGVRQGLTLPEPVSTDPGDLSDEILHAKGIERLPQHLEKAIAHLQNDELLLNALGSDLAKAFLAVRTAEWEFFKDKTLDDEVKLLLERY